MKPHLFLSSDARRFPTDPAKVVLLAIVIGGLYASGLACGGWAAKLSIAAAHDGSTIPWAPWLLAFFFMISGMLSVVYAFFFRPRGVELNNEEVALVKWDGKAGSIRRDEVKSVVSTGSRIILNGADSKLVISNMFIGWNDLKQQLGLWGSRPA